MSIQMRTLEAQLHEVLLEIAPDAHEINEQAIIIAEAAQMYRRTEAQAVPKLASGRSNSATIREARMTDALLQAMNRLAEWTEEEEFSGGVIDGRGLEPEQIVARASFAAGTRTASMDILGDGDLDVFFDGESTGREADSYDILDAYEDRHPSSLYFTPGRPRHRSDSIVR